MLNDWKTWKLRPESNNNKPLMSMFMFISCTFHNIYQNFHFFHVFWHLNCYQSLIQQFLTTLFSNISHLIPIFTHLTFKMYKNKCNCKLAICNTHTHFLSLSLLRVPEVWHARGGANLFKNANTHTESGLLRKFQNFVSVCVTEL